MGSVQKLGVCIGSKVAPLLSDIFLYTVNHAIEREVQGLVTKKKRFHYVDDFLIILALPILVT